MMRHLKNQNLRSLFSASLSTDKVMRRFTSSPADLLQILLAVIRRPSLLKSIYETYSSTTRQGGIGTRLLTAPETALQRKGIEHYKVVAGSKLIDANRFYIKNGFEKVAQVKIHGEEESNVYVKRVGMPANYANDNSQRY